MILSTTSGSQPFRRMLGALGHLRDDGLIDEIGLSNVSLNQVKASSVEIPVASVENVFSPFDQRDRRTVEYCADEGIAYMATQPLAGGVGGTERFNAAFAKAAAGARRRPVSVQQLTLAWLLKLSPALIPVCGATRPESIRDSASAATGAQPRRLG
jgi:aryl-alcohol dehydrogenase-like predicted oxidoreductase